MDKLTKTLCITSGIKHCGLSCYASILPRIKFGVTGQESSPQSPTFHTANRQPVQPPKIVNNQRFLLLADAGLFSILQLVKNFNHEKKLCESREKRSHYEKVSQDLKQSGEEQISLTDSDSRAVILHKNIINVGYNIQASSDSKHKLLVEYQTGSVNDTRALSDMAIASKDLLGLEEVIVLADKGYHTGEELARCAENGITTFVSPKAPATKETGLFPTSSFVYDSEKGHYLCPSGQTLTINGTWHNHSDGRNKRSAYRFRRYNTAACKNCSLRQQCTQSKTNGRYIDRSEFAAVIEDNAHRVNSRPDYYRKRQQITEHQFGTLKRQRGFTYNLVRTKDKVLGEVGLMFIPN